MNRLLTPACLVLKFSILISAVTLGARAPTDNPAASHYSVGDFSDVPMKGPDTANGEKPKQVSAASAPVMIPSLQSTRTAVDPQQLIPQDPAWEAGYQTRIGQLVNAKTWSIGSGVGDPDVGKRDWPALLGEMWKVKDSDASLQSFIDVQGMRLINSQYAGSFYKPFSVPGYNQFYFHFKDYSDTVGLNATQEAAALGISSWSHLTREDNRMDPIYGQTEFNSENFNWMARLGGLQWAFELPDTDLGNFAYNWQAGQPKGMTRAYFSNYMDNWTRALFNAGRVEWNAVIYWGYTFNPVLVLYDHPPVDPADGGFAYKVRNQARAGADWMVLESALHYLDGFTGGPGSRDKNTPYRPFTGSTWPFAYLYFADEENMPSYDLATLQAKVDRNMVGWFPWSDYRPLSVIKSIARRDFALPVEIQSAKPFYHLDHDNYAPWAGEGSYTAWKANKAAEEQAHRTGFRYEFETIYMDTNYLLASLATHRPNGSLGTFSEQTLFRLLVEGTDSGALQVFGNTGFSVAPSRRDPYEQIAQYGNVMMRVTKNPNASNNTFWFAVPTTANRVTDGNRLFVDMGNGVYFAVIPLGAPSLTVGAYTTDSTVNYQKATWAYGSGQLAAVVMEVGTQADHGSFAHFQAALSALNVTSPAANEVEFTTSEGKHLRMQWTGLVNDYPMTENGGYILSTGGTIPRTWRDGVEVQYNSWNSYEVVQGAGIVHQEWGSGLLRMAAGGEAVEIEVDPVTAEVTYYRVPLPNNDNEFPPGATYLAEEFDSSRGAFDLQHKRITFDWNGFGYTGFVEDIPAFETDIASTGTQLTLTSSSSQAVNLSGGEAFRFHGESYSTINVSSKGSLNFGSTEVSSYNAISYHFAKKRIAALFGDLRIENGGQVRWQQLADRIIIQYHAVRDGSGGSNTFQIEVYFAGRIRISWLGIALPYPTIGLSNGSYDAATFEQTDFSTWPGQPEPQTPMQQWLAGYFSTTEMAAGLADPYFDAEMQPDGVSNLLEYAFAMNPRAPDAHLAQVASRMVETAGTRSLEITFRRNPLATDLQFLLEASSDLADDEWAIVSPDVSGPASPDGDGTPRHTFRMELGDDPAFYRLRIEPVS